MSWQAKLITILIGAFLILLVGELLRKRKLEPEYAFLWFLTGIVLLVLSFWEKLLFIFTRLIGAQLAASTVFFFALIFLVAIALHFSIKISLLENKVKRLAQELSLQGERESHLVSPVDPPSPDNNS